MGLWQKVFPQPKADPNPSLDNNYLDILATIFGSDEARKELLNAAQQQNVSPEKILRDASAVEVMMRTFPWKVYNEAIWRRLITVLKYSLTDSFTDSDKKTVFLTSEQREGYRHQVLGILAILHLPYELKADKERVENMKKLEKEALTPK